MRKCLGVALAACLVAPADAQPVRPDQAQFRDIYRELVETNTTLSSGSCTLAAQRMAARLKTAGFPDRDLHLIIEPTHPKEGALVAVMPGTDPKAKPILLLGHLDVVEAKREDWTRDPFRFIEEDGYFYGRGTADMKAQVAIWVDMMARFKKEGFKPRRTLKMALTCGEESAPFNGARDLTQRHRALIDAEFALNEGGWGRMDEKGKRVYLGINAGEKTNQNFRLEVTNPGGHSMRPVKDNAIYHLSAGLLKIGAYDFPVQTTDSSRAFFAKMGPQMGGAMGAAMTAFAKDPKDKAAAARLATDPAYNAMLHTTCVATMLEAGHATNALPQRASANVNCRIFPGVTPAQVREQLIALMADPQIKVTILPGRGAGGPAPKLTDAVMKPILAAATKRWPDVPVVPMLEIGATDGSHLSRAGIPTYGFTGIFFEPDGSRL
ncbi:MAG TPA: M20/M25/M40 family metallo-hydrolase, partial [Rhizomicrobium sp.]|nr:M20/M25/M40 family metallo-hydrolase [Rhizomicrobium sp.]